MATRSSIRAWRIPWTEEPGGLQTIGSQRVRHNSKRFSMHTYLNIHKYLPNIKTYFDFSVPVLVHKTATISPCQSAFCAFSVDAQCSIILMFDN